MKKLFAMLLALCLMCGVVSAGAEEPQTFSATLAEFDIPADWELLVSMDDGAMFWGNYDPTDTSWIEIVICSTWGFANFDQCTSQADYFSSMVNMFFVAEEYNATISENFADVMPDGEPLVIGEFSDRETILCHRYNDIVMGLRFYNCAALYPTLDSILDVALPIYASVTNPAIEANRKTVKNTSPAAATEAAEAAAPAEAETAATQEVKIGNVTFQIPAGMEMTRMTNNDREYKSETCAIALVSWEMDAEMVQALVDEMKSQGQSFSFQQSAIVFGQIVGGMGQETAIQLALMAVPEDIGMLNGELVMSGKEAFTDTLSFYAQAYRDNYFSVIVMSEVLSQKEIEQIGKDIMRSVRIDGVTEEQMAADAEAARIAAEQAAMQKYVVITNSSANIRSGPGGDYAKVTTARQGDTFPLIGEDGNWYIIDVNGQTGYVTKGLSAIQ